MDDERDDDQQTAIVAYQSNALMRAEIDTQISTAKAFPRSIKRFKDNAREMATLDKETAASCTYSKPVGGGKIATGPSARFAEIIAVAWKNLRMGGRVVEEGDEFVKAQGVVHDMESNIQVTMELSESIMTSAKNGQKPRRYQNSQIAVVGSSAASKALRNAVLKAIPKAYWNPIYKESVKAAVGEGATLAQSRKEWLDYFVKKGVKLERILATVGAAGVDDIGIDELASLMGLANAIKEGETTLAEAFPVLQTSTESAAKDKLKTPATPAAAPSEPEKPEPPQESDMTQDTEMAIRDEMIRTGSTQTWLTNKVKEGGFKKFREISETFASGIIAELKEMPDRE